MALFIFEGAAIVRFEPTSGGYKSWSYLNETAVDPGTSPGLVFLFPLLLYNRT